MNARQFVNWALIGLVLLVGCSAPEGGGVAGAPTSIGATTTSAPATPAVATTIASVTATVVPPTASATTAPSTTPTIIVAPTPTPTVIATPTASLPDVTPVVCREAPVEYHLDTLLGMSMVADLTFLDADTLQITGWRPRSNLGNPSDFRYPTYIFDRTTIDLPTGALTPAMLPPERLLQEPCPECAGTYLLDESPDGGWQLVATTAGEQAGIWLVGPGTMTRLMFNMPTHLRWVWAADSSRLWLTYYTPEYSETPEGHFLMAVELDATPVVATNADWDTTDTLALKPGQYGLSFSPTDQQILAVPGVDNINATDDERFFLYDAAVTPPNLIAQGGPIAGLRAAVWDEALGHFLLIVAEDDVVEFRTLDGAVVAQIGAAALRSINPLLADKGLEEFILTHVPHALSPSRERVVIGYGSYGSILAVFDCVTLE